MTALAVIGCLVAVTGCGSSMSPAHGSAHADFLAVSQCMRRHGVPDFPDPTTTPPSNPSSFGLVEDEAGAVLAVPKTVDVGAPAFKAAAAACRFN
jgi:hypothetical protein